MLLIRRRQRLVGETRHVDEYAEDETILENHVVPLFVAAAAPQVEAQMHDQE